MHTLKIKIIVNVNFLLLKKKEKRQREKELYVYALYLKSYLILKRNCNIFRRHLDVTDGEKYIRQ